ncbi:protein disulfide isomerase EUG1 KNAG_0F00210 [Huiozyma naganishii CBS 8797]|uniref:protein disulfide-isomerase n=1 Tax=Huiozyma naganishii (strain ATCC MYA-139 / BCRC 22969 / CBS 8797 / KCTC 17520 / NBRC 10181 / NCYC 3082 / Yp74L-3) TaxID=1071383 RepID=J7RMC3_HUIN7|nr:hypothetical protein KNAG_0F00210 [Kazachstania naganishii CBS 8797]CCK70693.1 hypothetical protein KNAG_0F00210 [Kazachstania naganishii CBS 8797]
MYIYFSYLYDHVDETYTHSKTSQPPPPPPLPPMLGQFVVLISLLVSWSLGQSVFANEDDPIIERVGASNFAQAITSKDIILAEFTVPWCPHSKIFFPQLYSAAQQLKPHGIDIIQINCEKDEYICTELKINHYPTLKVFKNHRLARTADAEKDKTTEGIVQFMLAQQVSSVQKISTEEQLQDILQTNEENFVVVENAVTGFNKTYTELANEMFNTHVFVSFESKNNETNYDLAIYKPFNTTLNETRGEPIVYTGDLQPIMDSSQEFNSWLRYSVLPYFAEVTQDTFFSYMESKLPLAYYFYINKTDFEKDMPYFEKLGQKYKGQVNFIGLNALLFHNHVKFLNMREQFPLFAIHNMTNNRKYGIKQMPAEEYQNLKQVPFLNLEEVAQLVEDFVQGVADPLVKSEEIPETQEGNVLKVVAKNHDEIVHDANRDVIVRYYASWDVHSKSMEPLYNELADIFAQDESTRDKILFVDVDAGSNDILAFPVTSYPTIAMYPAGSESEPIVQQGPKTGKFLLSFIQNSGAHKLSGQEQYYARHPEEKQQKLPAVNDNGDVIVNADPDLKQEADPVEHDEL